MYLQFIWRTSELVDPSWQHWYKRSTLMSDSRREHLGHVDLEGTIRLFPPNHVGVLFDILSTYLEEIHAVSESYTMLPLRLLLWLQPGRCVSRWANRPVDSCLLFASPLLSWEDFCFLLSHIQDRGVRFGLSTPSSAWFFCHRSRDGNGNEGHRGLSSDFSRSLWASCWTYVSPGRLRTEGLLGPPEV